MLTLDVRAACDDRGATSGVESWGSPETVIVRVDQDIRPLVLSSLNTPNQIVPRDNFNSSHPFIHFPTHTTPSHHVQV